jgi:hypothetical protein
VATSTGVAPNFQFPFSFLLFYSFFYSPSRSPELFKPDDTRRFFRSSLESINYGHFNGGCADCHNHNQGGAARQPESRSASNNAAGDDSIACRTLN